MNESLTLRAATVRDAEILLVWRNDPQTRQASHNSNEVQWGEDISWLTKVLENPHRRLFIAEDNGVPVGTVRADFLDDVWELSWTVAPDARGRGIGTRMVVLLASQIREAIRAEVKKGNLPSIRIAESAGMQFEREEDGILHFRRPELQ